MKDLVVRANPGEAILVQVSVDLRLHRGTPPSEATIEVIHFTDEGRHSFCLSSQEWETITHVIAQAIEAACDSWSYPATDCCGRRAKREECHINSSGGELYISCQEGFGCRAESKENQG